MCASLMEKIHEIYFYKVPSPLWKVLNKFVAPIIMGIRADAYAKEFDPYHAIRLSGLSKIDNTPLKVTIFGSDIEAGYYSKMFFSAAENSHVEKLVLESAIPFSGLLEAVKKEEKNSDIVMVRTSQKHTDLFWANGFLVVPDQVIQEMIIPKDFSLVEQNFKEKVISTFPVSSELENVESEITHNPEDFKYFIEKMYVPTVKTRFKEAGFIIPLPEMELYFRNGCIIFIKKNGVRVCGLLVTYLQNRMFAASLGALEGDEQIIRAGYFTLTYIEELRHARSKGYDRIDFGQSRAFIMDGVLRFKSRIGAKEIRVNDLNPVIHAFHFQNPPSLGAIHALEKNNSFIIKNNRLAALAVFTSQNQTMKDVSGAYRRASSLGIKKIIFAAPGFDAVVKKQFEIDKLVVLIEEPDFKLLIEKVKNSV